MPKNTQIHSILVIGSGPIQIGQACEFDYSGTQALKALKEEGYRVILVNSNPATIMTDAELADATYIEPLTQDYLSAIIAKEQPDALIATLGGQTSLNCALNLHEQGILAHYNVQLIGASIEAIKLAENRSLFQQKMQEIGVDIPTSRCAHNEAEAIAILNELGLPLIIRSSFTLGGKGAAIVYQREQALQIFHQAFNQAQFSEITIDEALLGWKEFELEVVRDRNDNCIVVCGVENIDPLGIHTGDSATVAPIQTLTDREYQKMRDIAFQVLRAVGVDTGGSNVQFAVHPRTGRMVVIEMNPRVSRSSALVSKATGFPIAKIAAKLAVGYSLDELSNDITHGLLPASFEPSIDYVVTKIPRFHDEKFNAQDTPRGPQMRSIGEVMAMGSTFTESLHYALNSLETGAAGFHDLSAMDEASLKQRLTQSSSSSIDLIAEALRRHIAVDEIYDLCAVDPWFLQQINQLVQMEEQLSTHSLSTLSADHLRQLKQHGFSDTRIAQLIHCQEQQVRQLRQQLGIVPVYKCVDSCAAEFATSTAYLYSTYQASCESIVSPNKKIMIIGSGPNRIGQGIEFDYACVKAIQAFAEAGFDTIMVNCNPETVSTDYNVAHKLYFVPLTAEKVLDVIQKEQPTAVALQFGGQTPLNLLSHLQQAGVPLLGLTTEILNQTENRDQFRALLQQLKLKQPANCAVTAQDDWQQAIQSLTFPLIIRPSFILGGSGMDVVHDQTTLAHKLSQLFAVNDQPILIEEFLQDAIEVDIDAVCDGEQVFIASVLEHIEPAGIHSGDSACITPPYQLKPAIIHLLQQQTQLIARALVLKGLMNVQFAIKENQVYIIEVNPRASRTTPFISKATGIDIIALAVKCLLGESLVSLGCLSSVTLPYYCVKEAVLPFQKFTHACPLLTPEMKSTGETMGIGHTPYEAFLKAQIAAGNALHAQQPLRLFISPAAHGVTIPPALTVEISQQLESINKPTLMLVTDGNVEQLHYALQHDIPYASTVQAAQMLLNSLVNQAESSLQVRPLQQLYTSIRHPSKTKHLLTGMELSAEDIHQILCQAQALKQNPQGWHKALANKTLAMLFEKPSLRTRLSFAKAIQSLGGQVIESISSSRKQEEPGDLMRVLNGYVDFVMVRTHEEKLLKDMASHAQAPLINGLSALYHPCQILADLLSLQENFGQLEGLTVAYVGDGNNILHSLMLMAPLMGVSIQYCCPSKHQPNSQILAQAQIRHSNRIISCTTPQAAVSNAHAVYTDVWTSMGFESQSNHQAFAGFQVNEQLMAQARPEAAFMHCMPMERGQEVSYHLPDDPRSLIFNQSENRLHVQKALLLFFK